MKTIKVSTDDSIIAKLKNAFTSPGNVLSEAMQNARRAGATFVKVRYLDEDAIAIEDDGHGIDDMSHFLTLAGSGWKSDLIDREGAFGMGSFSMLYYCDRIKVESNGFGFVANTEDLLQHKEVALFESDVHKGTRIELFGYQISDVNNASRIEQELKVLASGFPIQVFYDETELLRPEALDSGLYSFVETEIGLCSIHEMNLDYDVMRDRGYQYLLGTKETQLYYQGLPVGGVTKHGIKNIVHLNEDAFSVRVPDRDVLISHDDAVQQIESQIAQMWREKLKEARQHLGDKVFVVKLHKSVTYWQFKKILNDIDYLPPGVMFYLSGMPVMSCSEKREDYTTDINGLNKTQIESEFPVILKIGREHTYDDILVEQYAFHLGFACVDNDSLSILDREHWLYGLISPISNPEISVRMNYPGDTGVYSGLSGFGFTYQKCRSVDIEGPYGSKAVYSHCVAITAKEMAIPSEAADGSDITVIAAFNEMFGSFSYEDYDRDSELFQDLINILNHNRNDAFLDMLKRSSFSFASLHNKQLVVDFDESGVPCSVREIANAA